MSSQFLIPCVLLCRRWRNVANLTHRKLDEIALKQKQREEEAEARRASRKTGFPEPPARAEPERTAPRLNLAPRTGGGPSWRERQAAKESTGGAAPEPAKEEPAAQPPRRTGGYVPPHLRSGSAAAPAASPSNGAAPSRYVPPSARDSGSSTPPSRTQTPATTSEEPKSAGKWVPRWKQQQGQ